MAHTYYGKTSTGYEIHNFNTKAEMEAYPYPFSKTEPVPSGYIYAFVKDQISFAITGKQPIECPHCRKPATAHVGGKHTINHRTTRSVNTTCRHCGTNISFMWS